MPQALAGGSVATSVVHELAQSALTSFEFLRHLTGLDGQKKPPTMQFLHLLPVGIYTLLVYAFAEARTVRASAEALLKAHLTIFLFIALSTELLSLAYSITLGWVVTFWGVLGAVSLWTAFRSRKQHQEPPKLVIRTDRFETPLLAGVSLILVFTFGAALLYPPNNWDSMTYHMPRVVHWIENQSVEFYSTTITRQNWPVPLAEFAIMHLQILSGGDAYANLVQWISFVATIGLGALIAAELGLTRWQQIISATLVATLPMAILQSNSTQNDLVTAVFVMAFAYHLLRYSANNSIADALWASVSLGLALLTKGTAMVFCAAIGLVLGVRIIFPLSQETVRRIGILGAIVIGALVINVGHLSRNYRASGSILGNYEPELRNKDHSAAAVAANVIKNSALHLGTPSVNVTLGFHSAIVSLLGSQLNNPLTMWQQMPFTIPMQAHEDYSGNLIHMLATIVLVAIAASRLVTRRFSCSSRSLYLLAIVIAGNMFCALLKWQVWGSRLHTPLFALVCPLLALVFTSGFRTRWPSTVLATISIAYALPFALDNVSRSLVSLEWLRDRDLLYFQNRVTLYADYRGAINSVPIGTKVIGLHLGPDDWEYPFWALARSRFEDSAPKFEHVIFDESTGISGGGVSEDIHVLLATKKFANPAVMKGWQAAYLSRHVAVFVRKSDYSVDEYLHVPHDRIVVATQDQQREAKLVHAVPNDR